MKSLLNKYQDLTIDEIKTKHEAEYTDALNQAQKQRQSTLAAIAGFSRLTEMIGQEKFKKAVDILDYYTTSTAEAAKRFVSAVNTTSSNATHRAIEEKYKKNEPGQSITIKDTLTPAEQKFQSEISGKGLRVFFAEFGAVPGAEVKKGFAVDENTIVLEKGLIEKYGVDAAWNKVIKVELVRALQFDSGILTVKSLADLDLQSQRLRPETNLYVEKNIDEAYADDSELSQMARLQAEAYAQILLFDDVSISNIAKTNTNIFIKVYKWLKEMSDKESRLARADKRSKLKYNMLLKTMRNYRNTIANEIYNNADAYEAGKLLSLTDEQIQTLIDKYLPNNTMSNLILLNTEDSPSTTQRTNAMNDLMNSRIVDARADKIDYSKVFDPTYYVEKFRTDITNRNPNKKLRR